MSPYFKIFGQRVSVICVRFESTPSTDGITCYVEIFILSIDVQSMFTVDLPSR